MSRTRGILPLLAVYRVLVYRRAVVSLGTRVAFRAAVGRELSGCALDRVRGALGETGVTAGTFLAEFRGRGVGVGACVAALKYG